MNVLASVCAGTVMAAGAATLPARAQPIQAHIGQLQGLDARLVQVSDLVRSDDGPYRGVYVGPPEPVPMEDDVVLAPEEIPGILRQQGFSQLGPVFLRGWVYTVAVLNEDGDDGRLIVDARSGEPIRFIPAMRMDTRLRDELDRMYDRPPPPPARFARDPYRDRPPRPDDPPRMADQDAPPPVRHHAAPLKRAAKTIAKTAPKSSPATVAVAPQKPADPQAVRLSGTPAAAQEPAKTEAKPERAAAGVELKPTAPMPPVQPMD